jgi:hypothetical protein
MDVWRAFLRSCYTTFHKLLSCLFCFSIMYFSNPPPPPLGFLLLVHCTSPVAATPSPSPPQVRIMQPVTCPLRPSLSDGHLGGLGGGGGGAVHWSTNTLIYTCAHSTLASVHSQPPDHLTSIWICYFSAWFSSSHFVG